MKDICVRHCWGNSIFDHAYSDSVGSSGGILCIWDPNSFNKHSVTVSDYFVIIRGTWRTSGQKVLMIAVYGPHDCRDKQSLWEFLHHEISKWRGEVIIMGDFNEVRFTSDRFGSNFNEHGAHMFNSFIADSGLVEVPLGGCHFTWCLKSAKKMSKLDRFLVSENLLVSCPHLTAVTLERYLSDHRPILLRENQYDYGPTSFRFFHHWIQTDDFDKIVSESWKNSPSGGTNAMKSLMYKLKHLKYDIREWNKHNMVSRKNMKTQYKKNLEAVDQILDSGQGVEEDIRVRSEIIRKLQNCDEIDSMELAQKAKIKWAIEGDENSKFFHGTLNKKRNILNIRGIMVDGIWVDNPKSVKREFLDHFSKRFCKPDDMRATLTMEFPNRLHPDQSRDLEMSVSNEEIKKAVWECGMDKAPGSIILNGSPTEEFEFGKGLKQGDPLSPFLFILIMESLHLSFQRVVDAGLFHGVKLRDTVTLSHLFYADDAVFVGQWSQQNISTLTHVLKCFHKASGLKINMCKSKILGIHVNNDNISRAAEDLGCQVLKLPFSYLGSMVGGRMHRLHSWDDTVDRVRNRLSKWKMKMLSSGGRLTLVKSVLGSMPIFHMSLFKVPAEKGGLGVSSLYALNRGLLFKWVWRFLTQGSSLWARVIKAIHGMDESIGDIRIGNSKSCWSSIINEINVLSSKGIKLMNYVTSRDTLKQVVLAQGSDHWTWTANGSGQFSVASVRKIIDNKLCSGGENSTRWIRCCRNPINTSLHNTNHKSNQERRKRVEKSEREDREMREKRYIGFRKIDIMRI
ncbi:RNA-directed DNA polymerase, eukaryota [Tanacetum coccineum]